MNEEQKGLKQDLNAEIDQYEDEELYIDSGHWTSHPIFASRARHWLAYDVAKIRFYSDLVKYISSKDYYKNARILIAPIGTGEESLYLMNIYKSIYGIDISNTALLCCPGHIKTIEGDILESGFENEYFDIIICPLFLHHVHKIGFLPFLQEFHRILKRGGGTCYSGTQYFIPIILGHFIP